MENVIHTFKKATPAKSVMFSVAYDDGRTAYMVVENHGKANEDYLAGAIAARQQEQGLLPPGIITGVKRVR